PRSLRRARGSPDRLRDVSDALCVGERAQFLEALVLALTDAISRDVERAADLVERARLLTVEPVAQFEHHPFALGERAQDRAQSLALQRRLRKLVRERRG